MFVGVVYAGLMGQDLVSSEHCCFLEYIAFSSVDMGMNSDEDEESEDYIGDVNMNQVHSTNSAPGELHKKMRVDDNQGNNNNGSSGNNDSSV